MKPTRLILYHLRMPLVRPFETSFGRISTRDCLLVEIAGRRSGRLGRVPRRPRPGLLVRNCGHGLACDA